MNSNIDTLQKIEVAEGVEILLRPAGPVPRALAYLLDLLIRGGVFLLLIIALQLSLSWVGLPTVGAGISLLIWFLIDWWYFVIFEITKRAASPGKRAMGLKVVRSSGTPVDFKHATLRNLLRAVDGGPFLFATGAGTFAGIPVYIIGVICCLTTKRFQRLGDLLADTVVIYEPKSGDGEVYAHIPLRENHGLVPIPPPYALTKSEQQAVVLFLERGGVWSDARKEELVAHVPELTRHRGRMGVLEMLSMGLWLRDS